MIFFHFYDIFDHKLFKLRFVIELWERADGFLIDIADSVNSQEAFLATNTPIHQEVNLDYF